MADKITLVSGSPISEAMDIPFESASPVKIAIDLGGSLAKVAFSTPLSGSGLYFAKFNVENVQELVDFLKSLIRTNYDQNLIIKATGGGSLKLKDRLEEELGVTIEREDEIECLISGLHFLLSRVPSESFTYSDTTAVIFENPENFLFPYLLVNVGSGVSILKVNKDSYERISGTSLGGGTLWGLLSLLTDADTFDEMLEMSQRGDNKNIDLLVGDIYGTDYAKIGLKSSIIASTLGKVFKKISQG